MGLSKHYIPSEQEPALDALWQQTGLYHFSLDSDTPVFSIDTDPPTVSGNLHLGHVFSYTHTDIIARFWRMRGYNVFYPMGFDDNGLPTERLVERRLGLRAADIGRAAFIERCLAISEEAERDYRALWTRLGLSVDWRYTYRTIDDAARRTSQWSFLDLYRRGLAYRQTAPVIWCPECRTAIAQAELDDLDRESTFYTLGFRLPSGATLPIATTRPELLPACVAVFVHPDDARYASLVGQHVTTPLGGEVLVLADPRADPAKGTGAVMCCTFGDATDIEWWREYNLPTRVILGRDGRLTEDAGDLAGLPIAEARARIVASLRERGLLLGEQSITQSVRIHERCDTPVEYIVAPQWFVRALDFKPELVAAGERIAWHPEHMGARYQQWVENLKWDWCISRQRYFGVPFPVWYCDACGEIVLADESQLPVDPLETQPLRPCPCGSTSSTPDEDVMDTWATSSLSPQIAGRWMTEPGLYERVFPFSMRPQAHEIIRTWAFYTILKSLREWDAVPFRNVAISGWGLAPAGTAKISKSRGGGPIAPMALFEKYSADAARYWSASTGPGKDAVISEEKIALGAKLITKLWNVARFAERFVERYQPPLAAPPLSPADRWILARAQRLVARVTALMTDYDYAAAKSEIEAFFWQALADNYMEMAKSRLYDAHAEGHAGARYTLRAVLLTVVKLFAPFLPHVTDAIYRELFAAGDGAESVHVSAWPIADDTLTDSADEAGGDALVDIATAVRRFKSEASISLGAELARLQLATADTADTALAATLRAAAADLRSVTRARQVEVGDRLDPTLTTLAAEGPVRVAVEL
jgi:valyl-tRNA synthetase